MDEELYRTYEEVMSPDLPTRIGALKRLEALSREKKADGKAVTYLISALKDSEPEVRRKASWTVGKLAQNKEDACWPLELLNVLLHDDDPEVRENAAWAIGELAGMRIGVLSSIGHLDLLLGDANVTVRGMAAWALGRLAERIGLGYSTSVEPLKTLLEDRSVLVRESAAYALDRLRGIGVEE